MIKNQLKKLFWRFETFVEKPWYEWAVAFLVFIDLFLMVVPCDALLVTSTMSAPRKWLRLALFTAVGYTLGALAFSYVVQLLGWPFLNHYFPELSQSYGWKWTETQFLSYGMWVLFIVALAPVMQHPALILAVLAGHPLAQIFWIVLIGRIIKYVTLSYLSRFAPTLLKRLWGVKSELEIVGAKKL